MKIFKLISEFLSGKDPDKFDVNKINFEKAVTVLKKNTIIYQIVPEGELPLTATGKANRFVSQDPHLTIAKYRAGAVAGTGGTFASLSLSTAFKEIGGYFKKDWYKITLKECIEAYDIEKIFKQQHIRIPEERHPVYQEFYGTKKFAYIYPSFKDFGEKNIVIFTDWRRDYKNLFHIEKIYSAHSKNCFGPDLSSEFPFSPIL